MNIGRFRFIGVAFIVAAMLSVAATSHALPTRGSHLEGVVTALDTKARLSSAGSRKLSPFRSSAFPPPRGAGSPTSSRAPSGSWTPPESHKPPYPFREGG